MNRQEYLATINDPEFLAAAYSVVTGVDTESASAWVEGVSKAFGEHQPTFTAFSVDPDVPCALIEYRTLGMPNGVVHQMRLGKNPADWDRWAMSPNSPDTMRI